MLQHEASSVVASCVLDQLNRELRNLAVGASISPMLDAAEAGAVAEAGAAAKEAVQLSAYISCKVCVESDFHAVQGTIPLLVSDAMRLTGITGARHVSLFFMSKHDLKAACDLTNLLEQYISPLFGVTIAGNVSFTLNSWGVPFYNRVQDFQVDGIAFADLPEQLLVGTNGQ